jgi:hypothetical protein
MPITIETWKEFCTRQACEYHEDAEREMYEFENGAICYGFEGNKGRNEAPADPRARLEARIAYWKKETQIRKGYFDQCTNNISTIILWHSKGVGPRLDPRNFDTLREVKERYEQAVTIRNNYRQEHADTFNKGYVESMTTFSQQAQRAKDDQDRVREILNS